MELAGNFVIRLETYTHYKKYSNISKKKKNQYTVTSLVV